MTPDETRRNRIRAGAAWLDEHKPGWRDHVVINDLDLSNTCRCVLGQIFTPVIRVLRDENPDLYRAVVRTTDTEDEDGYLPGYMLATRGLEGYYDDDGNFVTVINDHRVLTTRQAQDLAFDMGYGDESWEELTGDWRTFLKGEWT